MSPRAWRPACDPLLAHFAVRHTLAELKRVLDLLLLARHRAQSSAAIRGRALSRGYIFPQPEQSPPRIFSNEQSGARLVEGQALLPKQTIHEGRREKRLQREDTTVTEHDLNAHQLDYACVVVEHGRESLASTTASCLATEPALVGLRQRFHIP